MSDETKRRGPRLWWKGDVRIDAAWNQRFVTEQDYDALARELAESQERGFWGRAAARLSKKLHAVEKECEQTNIALERERAAWKAERDRLRERVRAWGQAWHSLADYSDAAKADLRDRVEELEKIQTALALGQPAVEANKKLLARAERAEAKLRRAVDCVPMNWTDSLLTGPDGIDIPAGCPDIQKVLRGIRERIAALADEEPSDGE